MRLLLLFTVWISVTSAIDTFADQPPADPSDTARAIAEGHSFTEGPAVADDGTVYFTDQPNDRVQRITPDGELSTFLTPAGRSNGLYFAPDGRLIACADGDNEIWAIDVDTGRHEVLIRQPGGVRLNGPNDVWVHPTAGVMFFTDPYYQRPWWEHDMPPREARRVYRADLDGSNVRPVDGDFVQPNGIVGDVDRGRLYVADIDAKKTYVYDMAADGELSGRRLFCEMGSDGMTVDDDGNVYLTGQGVTGFDVDGRQIRHIDVPENWTANVTIDPTRSRLIITAMGKVYAADL